LQDQHGDRCERERLQERIGSASERREDDHEGGDQGGSRAAQGEGEHERVRRERAPLPRLAPADVGVGLVEAECRQARGEDGDGRQKGELPAAARAEDSRGHEDVEQRDDGDADVRPECGRGCRRERLPRGHQANLAADSRGRTSCANCPTRSSRPGLS
jgi:hypothetical protein